MRVTMWSRQALSFGRRCKRLRRQLLASLPFAIVISCAPALAESGADAPIGAASLPRDLSPWGMFLQADTVVKTVMIGLAFATIVTCTVWLSKTIELCTARRNARRALRALGEATSLDEAIKGAPAGMIGRLLDGATAELDLSTQRMDKEGIKARVESRLQQIEAGAGRRIGFGVGILATIGSTAPFVGLFGTVWGIMNSFIGISKSQTTNLAVVAPGIAEALQATALGLVAAIPAVVIYNLFARQIASYRAILGDGSLEIVRLVGRDLDSGAIVAQRRLAAAE